MGIRETLVVVDHCDVLTTFSTSMCPTCGSVVHWRRFLCQYDVINIGKDGIGAVSSSGQGSLWRVEALKGRSPDGKTGVDPKDLKLVGKELGFRSEMLIEDTHTSIDLFRQVG